MDCKKTYRVAMAVTNDMSADRRVARHAAALREAGCEVVVVCRGLVESGERRMESDATQSASATLSTLHSPLSTTHLKGWRFYLEFNMALRRKLLELKPDIVWANDTDTLLGCWLAARRLRCRLVMDSHELFPEVPEIQHKPLVKWVWRTIERLLMPKCDALLTVCQSIADYYKRKYNVEMTVVRNVPEYPDYPDNPELPVSPKKEAVLLYQGAVNLGRGVDWAIDALEWLPQCRLVVAGKGDLLDEMKAYSASKPWADRITFLGQVPPSELPALTRTADVGLVMLEDMGLSYHFALPNRIGDFVAASVPMVVSDLPEMAAVVKRYGVGEIIGSGEWRAESGERRVESGERRAESGEWKVESGKRDARALAEAVERVLAREWTEADFTGARKDMNWENEKTRLINIARNLKP